MSLTKNQALVYALMIRAQAVTTEVKGMEVRNAQVPGEDGHYKEQAFIAKADEMRQIADQIIEVLAKREA